MRDLLQKGEVIPFLGAGVSLSARPRGLSSVGDKKPFLPSNRELKELLARECDFPPTEFEASDIAEVAAFFVQRFGRRSLDELLDKTLGRIDYTPSDTHRLLAESAKSTPLIILTTNYDTLMEQALDELGLHYDVVAYMQGELAAGERLAFFPYGTSYPEFVEPSTIVAIERTSIFRLHGPAIKEGLRTGSYVLTEEDQIDWLLRLRTHNTALPAFVAATLQRSHLLSLGHSARDWSQRALLRTLFENTRRRRTAWAVALNPALLSVMTWQRYGVEIFNVELNEWAARMGGAGPTTV